MTRALHLAWDAVTSLKLTLVCLFLLMALVVLCTFAQVQLGTRGAVDVWIRSFFVWWDLPGSASSVPIFPGGGLVGAVMLVNLVAAQARRMEWTVRKLGLWIVHAGLIDLFLGEFVTSALQVEMQLAIEQGQTADHVQSPRELELALIDVTDADSDDAYGIPEPRLRRPGVMVIPGTPISLRVIQFLPNAGLSRRAAGAQASPATAGVGPLFAIEPLPTLHGDEDVNRRVVLVEALAGGTSYGTFLVSNGIKDAQSFVHAGHTWELSMRPRREYLPYSITLRKFSHEVYAGTDIPKNFSSLVHLSNPARGDERDLLIYMNQPLRYQGKAFYQASFGKGDTLSVLQVVGNPGWLLPYLACALVAAGLVVHFTLALRRSLLRPRRRLESA